MAATCLPSSSPPSLLKPPLSLQHTTKEEKKTRSAAMGSSTKAALLLLALLLSYGVMGMAVGYDQEEEGRGRGGREEEEEVEGEGEEMFLLHETKHVMKTDAGGMKVVKSPRGRVRERSMHIGFITMEPKTLFIPQYLDSSLIIFIRRGEAKIGMIQKDEFVEKQLKMGDLYRIPAGSAFYLVNTGKGQRLDTICSIDPSESLGLAPFQSFFIGGGTYPTSILAGFDQQTLATAFNVSQSELRELIMTGQREGPIVYVTDTAPTMWTRFLNLKEQDRIQHLKKMVDFEEEEADQGEKHQTTWQWRKLLSFVFGQENKKREDDKGSRKSPDPINIYDKDPDFRNNYGWSIALDGSKYKPFKRSGIGAYLVNLTAGAILAPHVNPTATEYGIVLSGSGNIQIVFPNGSTALNADVYEGDVFRIPRYFPFCQVASRTGPFEFFGFTTSARKNRPQFLAGSCSALNDMISPALAAAFGTSEERIRSFLEAQHECIILPPELGLTPETEAAAPQDKKQHHHEEESEAAAAEEKRQHHREEEKGLPKIVKSFGNDIVMGFD